MISVYMNAGAGEDAGRKLDYPTAIRANGGGEDSPVYIMEPAPGGGERPIAIVPWRNIDHIDIGY